MNERKLYWCIPVKFLFFDRDEVVVFQRFQEIYRKFKEVGGYDALMIGTKEEIELKEIYSKEE